MEEFDEDMEEFDEEEDDDDDTSWRVRRASYKVITSMVRAIPNRLGDFLGKFTLPVVQRFNSEREQNVKLDAFNCIEEMIRACVVRQDGRGGARSGVVPVVGGENLGIAYEIVWHLVAHALYKGYLILYQKKKRWYTHTGARIFPKGNEARSGNMPVFSRTFPRRSQTWSPSIR